MVSWYFGINTHRDLEAYVGMSLECHPVWWDLALHRIYKGQSVDAVIKQSKPAFVVRHGRFVELRYQEPFSYTGVQIVAMDGALTRAWAGSCTWDFKFFDSMSDIDIKEMSESFDKNARTVEYNGEELSR